MNRVLIAVTSHDQFGKLERKTGYWLGEVTHFWHVMNGGGIEVDFVSPRGGKPPLDEKSVAPRDPVNRAFLENRALVDRLETSQEPRQVDPARYAAIYFAGGHGAMWDFPKNDELGRIAATIHEQGGIVSAVCHGSAGLLNIRRRDGRLLIEGQPVTGFANLEERLLRLRAHVPYLLQDELVRNGGHYKSAWVPFSSFVITQERLVSGQNPQSARATAKAVLALLPARSPPQRP